MTAAVLLRIPDTLPSFRQELDQIEENNRDVANDNRGSRRSGRRLAPVGARFERSVQNLRNGDFEASERALRADLDVLEALAASASDQEERRAIARREAITRRLLADVRLEQLDTIAARALYASGYGALKDDTRDIRWDYARQVAIHLEAMGAATGLADMADAAVVFARATQEVADNPGDAHILLGRTLIGAAARAADTARIKEALAAFEAALLYEESQERPEPSRLTRIRVNLAGALRLLGEREYDQEKTWQAVTILRAVLEKTTPSPVSDWPRAQDTLGNALADLDQYDQAIAAYNAALAVWADAAGRARTLSNLGTVLQRLGRFEEAHAAHDSALALLSHERQPLAWARVKSNQADVLAEQGAARAANAPALAKSCLMRAVAAYEAALEKRQRAWSPLGWAVTTVDLAAARAMLGDLELSGPLSKRDSGAGLSHLHRAVSLCVEALPDLTAPDRVRACGILAVTLLPLARNAAGNGHHGAVVEACATLLAAIGAREFEDLRDGVVAALRLVGEALPGDPANDASPAAPVWPAERYSESREAKRGGGGIAAYLERVWRDLIQIYGIDLRTLRTIDPAAAMAVSNLRRAGRTLPEHLVLPTLAEKHDREARFYQDTGVRPARLDRALRRRAWRAANKSTL